MKRKNHRRNIEWVIILTIALLVISLLFRFISCFSNNNYMIQIANIIGAVSVILLAIWFIIFLIASPFIKKYIIEEMKKEYQKKIDEELTDNDKNLLPPPSSDK